MKSTAAVVFASGVAAAVALGVGAGLGALAWSFMVASLAALVMGLVIGVVLGTLLVVTRAGAAWRGGTKIVAVALPVVIGWGAMRWVEDGHIRTGERLVVARARAAASGLGPVEVGKLLDEPGAIDFWARDVDADHGTLLSRWWDMADHGVRLAGSWMNGRVLPVGKVGVVVWSLFELFLAGWLAVRVTHRSLGPVSARSP